jgi:hypothetical protein
VMTVSDDDILRYSSECSFNFGELNDIPVS